MKIQIEKTQTQQGPRVRAWPREWRVVTTAGVTPDPTVAAIVKQYEDKLDENLKVAVGTTTVVLDSRRATVRLKEAVIGNLIADAIRESAKADVAITNGGGIRGDRTYAAGTTLTRKDVLRLERRLKRITNDFLAAETPGGKPYALAVALYEQRDA